MTVYRMLNGRLWLHAPMALNESVMSELEALGAIEFLVAPNALASVVDLKVSFWI